MIVPRSFLCTFFAVSLHFRCRGVPLFASNEFRPHHRGASRHLFQTIGRAAGFSLHWLPESVTGVELELAIPSDFSRSFPAKRLSNRRVASAPVTSLFGSRSEERRVGKECMARCC